MERINFTTTQFEVLMLKKYRVKIQFTTIVKRNLMRVIWKFAV